MKGCVRCGQYKPVLEFPKQAASRDGLSSYCKQCHRESAKASYEKKKSVRKPKATQMVIPRSLPVDRERERANRQAWKEANRDKARTSDAITRHKRRVLGKTKATQDKRRTQLQKHVYMILPKEIARLKRTPCAYCGSTTRITLDHIVPLHLGGQHRIGNLQPLCHSCNTSKGTRLYAAWRYQWKAQHGRAS